MYLCAHCSEPGNRLFGEVHYSWFVENGGGGVGEFLGLVNRGKVKRYGIMGKWRWILPNFTSASPSFTSFFFLLQWSVGRCPCLRSRSPQCESQGGRANCSAIPRGVGLCNN